MDQISVLHLHLLGNLLWLVGWVQTSDLLTRGNGEVAPIMTNIFLLPAFISDLHSLLVKDACFLLFNYDYYIILIYSVYVFLSVAGIHPDLPTHSTQDKNILRYEANLLYLP